MRLLGVFPRDEPHSEPFGSILDSEARNQAPFRPDLSIGNIPSEYSVVFDGLKETLPM